MDREPTNEPTRKRRVGRRSLIAGAAAAAGGAVAAKLGSTNPAQAADGQAILQGTAGDAQNVASSQTTLTAAAAATGSALLALDATPASSGLSGLDVRAGGSGVGVIAAGGPTGGAGVLASGGGSSPGLIVFGGPTNGAGVVATGNGNGSGVNATASGNGSGIIANGGPAGGDGVVAAGGGGGRGLTALGNGSAVGVYAQGGVTGEGLQAFGGGPAAGVYAQGGSSDGVGIVAAGGGAGFGISAFGGSGGGIGVRAEGSGAAPGVLAQGGLTGGTGVSALGVGTGRGVFATSPTTGLYGVVTGSASLDPATGAGAGVFGRTSGAGAAPDFQFGVVGVGVGISGGVYGTTSASLYGAVVGEHTGAGVPGNGVFGVSNAPWAGNNENAAGVLGQNSNDGPGVAGVSANGIGVFGYNLGSGDGDPAACGGFFTTTGNNTNAMVSQVFNNVTNAAAFVGSATPGGGRLAGYFNGDTQFTGNESHTGNVTVNGDHTVTGTKSAAVPMADGRLHKVYAVEAPESWFEDYGEAAMTGNSTFVPFPADFAQVVDTSKYHVFLTPTGGAAVLGVESRTPQGFTVVAQGRGSSGFSYRIVAKRKDVASPRFDGFEPPAKANIRLPFDAPPPAPGRSVGTGAHRPGSPAAGPSTAPAAPQSAPAPRGR